jgi:3-hydroxyacyl-[acyl-carrier-protein] dehydratase
MRFELVDRVLEISPERAVTVKLVSAAEEYLQDHFPGFPVLPGVMMLEAMVQSSRRVLERFGPDGLRGPQGRRAVVGRVRALKYGQFVKPGSTIRVEVSRLKDPGAGVVEFKGEVVLLEPGAGGAGTAAGEPAMAASGRFTMRAPITSRTGG